MSPHKKYRVINDSVAIMKNYKIPFKRDDNGSRLRINEKINTRRERKIDEGKSYLPRYGILIMKRYSKLFNVK